MTRLNRILAAALAVQALLAAAVFVPRLIPSSVPSQPLLGEFSPQDATGLAVQDNQGERVELAKKDGAWVYPAGDDYPANATAIETFLDKIAALKTYPLVTQTSASHKRLKVADDDFLRKVELTLADGSRRALFVGSSAGSNAAYVRVGGQDDVFQSSGLTQFDASAKLTTWIDPVYFSVAQDNMISLTVQNASGTLEFDKGGDGKWALAGLAAGETLNADSLTTMLSRLSSLRMLRPLGKQAKPEYGLDTPASVITLVAKGDDGSDQTYTIRVGTKFSEDDSYAVIASTSAYTARIAAFSIGDFVTKTRQDFIQLPPTPTAAPEAAATPAPQAPSAVALSPASTPQPSPTP